MKTSTAVLIATIGVLLSVCVGVLGGAVAGFYVSRMSPRTLSRAVPFSDLPSLPFDQGLPTLPNSGPRNRAFPISANGAVVMQVTSGSPAEKAGVTAGDVITAVDGQAVDDAHPLNQLIAQRKPGDSVELSILRGSNKQTLKLTLGTNPDNSSAPYLGIRFTMFEKQVQPTPTPPGQTG